MREAGQLRLVLVCDQCGAECGELSKVDYRTQARPSADGADGVSAVRASRR